MILKARKKLVSLLTKDHKTQFFTIDFYKSANLKRTSPGTAKLDYNKFNSIFFYVHSYSDFAPKKTVIYYWITGVLKKCVSLGLHTPIVLYENRPKALNSRGITKRSLRA
jgi:hypothetical protein